MALKILTRLEPLSLYRFKREFRTLTGVVHRNLVILYGLHQLGETWALAMELVVQDSAIRDQDWTGMRGVAQATRHRLGQLIGGDEGRALCDRAQAWFEEQSVQSPESFMEILCPSVS